MCVEHSSTAKGDTKEKTSQSVTKRAELRREDKRSIRSI